MDGQIFALDIRDTESRNTFIMSVCFDLTVMTLRMSQIFYATVVLQLQLYLCLNSEHVMGALYFFENVLS